MRVIDQKHHFADSINKLSCKRALLRYKSLIALLHRVVRDERFHPERVLEEARSCFQIITQRFRSGNFPGKANQPRREEESRAVATFPRVWNTRGSSFPAKPRSRNVRIARGSRQCSNVGFRTFLFFIGPSKVAPLNGPRHIASVVSCVDGEIRMGIKDGRARYPHATELRVSWLEPNENPPEKRESACDNGA